MFRRIGTVVMLALAFGAVAQEADLASVTSLKVDLEQVVQLGTVSPVDGITAAGQPDKAALEVFTDAGYATVIDIRGEDENRGFEEAAFVEELGMHYVLFPIDREGDISFASARKLDELGVNFYATGGTGRFETAELVEVTWRGGIHLVTFETYSTLDGRPAYTIAVSRIGEQSTPDVAKTILEYVDEKRTGTYRCVAQPATSRNTGNLTSINRLIIDRDIVPRAFS